MQEFHSSNYKPPFSAWFFPCFPLSSSMLPDFQVPRFYFVSRLLKGISFRQAVMGSENDVYPKMCNIIVQVMINQWVIGLPYFQTTSYWSPTPECWDRILPMKRTSSINRERDEGLWVNHRFGMSCLRESIWISGTWHQVDIFIIFLNVYVSSTLVNAERLVNGLSMPILVNPGCHSHHSHHQPTMGGHKRHPISSFSYPIS